MTAMRSNIECCKDCLKRHTGCHSACEDYKREKAELEALRSAIQAKRDADALYASYNRNSKHKRRAKYNLHSRKGGTKK